MKIIVVGRCYQSLGKNTLGLFEFDQAKALSQAGHDVYYLGIDYRSVRHIRKLGIEEEDREGVHIICVSYPFSGVRGKVKDILVQATMCKAYNYIIDCYGEPDIIHAHFFECAYYISLILKDTNAPFFITEHSSRINQEVIRDKDRRMALYAYGKATMIICVSEALKEKVSRLTQVACCVIPNIVNTEIFKVENERVLKTKFVFITVANLVHSKRIINLVKAFIELLKYNSNIELILDKVNGEYVLVNKKALFS